MGGRWWRAYNEARDDPKLQRLSGDLFKAWFNIMCIASDHDGELPPIDDLAFKLRVSTAKAKSFVSSLRAAGLLDGNDETMQPHNWNGRQFKTDVTDPTNADRQTRHRNRKRNGKDNGHSNGKTVTPTVSDAVTIKRPDTEADSETEQKAARAGDLRKRITQIYLDHNAEPIPDTGRAETWIAQGLDPTIIIAVIGEIMGRQRGKPKPLAYFDNPIMEAHAKKATKPVNGIHSPRQKPAQETQELMAKTYAESRCEVWNFNSPRPGREGCEIDPGVLRRHGINPETGQLTGKDG